MAMASGVYIITCTRNGMVYVGASRQIIKRLAGHKTLLKHGSHPNKRMVEDYRQHGVLAFEFSQVSEIACIREAMKEERRLIRHYASTGRAYNKQVIPAINDEMLDMRNEATGRLTPRELIEIGEGRYSSRWVIRLAEEIGWNIFTISRAANGRIPISEKLEKDIRALKPKKGTKS